MNKKISLIMSAVFLAIIVGFGWRPMLMRKTVVLAVGTDGVLIVAAGQTVSIPAGSTKQYTSVLINATGVLNITGSSSTITTIQSLNDFTVNGTINMSYGPLNQSKTYNSLSFSDTKTQQSAGSSGGQSNGSNGQHSSDLIIYSKSLTGIGSINLKGENGGIGAAATAGSLTCDGTESALDTLTDICGKKTCVFALCCTVGCYNVAETTDDLKTKLLKQQQQYAKNIINMLIDEANAGSGVGGGGGDIDICGGSYPACVQATPTAASYNADRGGGGAGGNGGNLWIRTLNYYDNSIAITATGGLGGLLSSIGSGGSAGNNGLNGIINVDQY